MNPFELSLPDSIAKASAEADDNAAFKAAGIDLLDRLKERVTAPDTVIDLLELRAELGAVRVRDGGVEIGALVTLAELSRAGELGDPAFAAVRTAAGEAATPLIRNRATVGGNLLQETRCWYYRSAAFACAHDRRGPVCLAIEGDNRYHAIMGTADCMRVHPSTLAPALCALGAEVTIQKGEERRTMPLAELYPQVPLAAAAEHTLEQGEILTAVHLPRPAPGTRSAYRESREKASFDWPTTAAAVSLTLAGGEITAAAICLGAVAPVPLPRNAAAAMLVGRAPSPELFLSVAAAVFEGARPLTHNAYKIDVGQAVLRAALTAAAS